VRDRWPNTIRTTPSSGTSSPECEARLACKQRIADVARHEREAANDVLARSVAKQLVPLVKALAAVRFSYALR
jgi:hypothetical protein